MGGTSSTGNVAKDCFNNKRDFLRWATSTIAPEDKEKLITIRTNLGAILRVFTVAINWTLGNLKCFAKVLMSIL